MVKLSPNFKDFTQETQTSDITIVWPGSTLYPHWLSATQTWSITQACTENKLKFIPQIFLKPPMITKIINKTSQCSKALIFKG